MYTATIFAVSIVSPGVTIEEEHIARETLNRWNAESGAEKGKVFLPLPSDSAAETDIYVLPIDNYVDITKANKIIATGKPVILLFSEYHDEGNTIPAELKEVEVLKNIKAANCIRASYNGSYEFEQALITAIEQIEY